LIAVGAAGPAVEARTRHQVLEPAYVVSVQDRGDRQQIRSLREIVGMIRARYGGEMVGSQLVDGPRPTYFIRWRMPNDEYRDFQVDAVSGQIR
jgi:uncharacterized membrane protein YkoI